MTLDKNIFIKESGDLIYKLGPEDQILVRPDVLEAIAQRQKGCNLTLCPGGGSGITERLDELGIPWKFGLLGREIESHNGRLEARNVLEDNRAIVQDQLRRAGIIADVAIPVLMWGTVLCHVNGDLAVLSAYHGHDKLYIFTFKGKRLKKKRSKFKKYPKVEVIGFPEKYKGWVEL